VFVVVSGVDVCAVMVFSSALLIAEMFLFAADIVASCERVCWP